MNRQNRTGFWSDRGGEFFNVYIATARLNIHKHWTRTDIRHRPRRGDKCERHRDYLIAGSNAGGDHRQM
jgi:hypothetical protein